MVNLDFSYSKNVENKIKFLLNDGKKQKLLKVSLYLIKDSWYIDISDANNDLLIGKIINTWSDLFEILRIYHKNFPNVQLVAIPSNINGINKEFNTLSAGILQKLFLIGGK